MPKQGKITPAIERVATELQAKYGDAPIPVAEIKDIVCAETGCSRGSVIPSDHSYNMWNDNLPPGHAPMFIQEKEGFFRFLGRDFNYSGPRYHDQKGGAKSQCGTWLNGVYRHGVVPSCDYCLEERFENEELLEGKLIRVLVNRYERNSAARSICINYCGAKCTICSFDFGLAYGPEAEGFIHVHHLIPIASIGDEYEIDPVKDLVPVCANCHAVIHIGGDCRSIAEVRLLWSRGSQSTSSASIRITQDSSVMGGKPCIRGLRVTVGMILGLLSSGTSRERILQAYPYLESEDIDAALAYAASNI